MRALFVLSLPSGFGVLCPPAAKHCAAGRRRSRLKKATLSRCHVSTPSVVMAKPRSHPSAATGRTSARQSSKCSGVQPGLREVHAMGAYFFCPHGFMADRNSGWMRGGPVAAATGGAYIGRRPALPVAMSRIPCAIPAGNTLHWAYPRLWTVPAIFMSRRLLHTLVPEPREQHRSPKSATR